MLVIVGLKTQEWRKSMQGSLLVVAAHPDDEVLGCGGVVIKEAKRRPVHILVVGEGVSSRYPERSMAKCEELAKMRELSRRVSIKMGAEGHYFLGLPDNRLDEFPLLKLTKCIEEVIAAVKPEVVLTHHAGDLNLDHQLVHRAVLIATRPQLNMPVQDVYAFETPSSTEWRFAPNEAFCPNIFVDIIDTIEAKIAALMIYDSEFRAFPHPRSREAIHAMASWRGACCGFFAAEAYMLVRGVRNYL